MNVSLKKYEKIYDFLIENEIPFIERAYYDDNDNVIGYYIHLTISEIETHETELNM